VVVFLIGLASVLLLLWVARLGEIQRDNFRAADALHDLQLHLATFHIRLEEDLHGDTTAGLTPVWTRWNQAERLVEVMLLGGLDDHGQLLLPLQQSGHLTRARGIRSSMAALTETVAQRLQLSRTAMTDPVVEERFHQEFEAIISGVAELDGLLEAQNARYHVRSKRVIKLVSAAWALIVLVLTAGLFRSENRRMTADEELRLAHEVALAQTEELQQHKQHLAEMVNERTAELSSANERLHAEIIEHRLAEDALREKEAYISSLSSRLLQAQEFERRRIAMELHDELGQALNVMKLQIRIVERGLAEAQGAAKEECEKLLDYIDRVIEDVRRLSLNLSPTVLEDLGLTSALHWLITGFAQKHAVQVTSEIEPIDPVFPAPFRIVVYRVIQEALTNIARHAGAGLVTVIIRRQGGEVAFLVEDDGVGFAVEQNVNHTTPGSSFGLATMQERVRMIGGHFELWSQKGKGTRITFTVPLETGGS
jgi:signal transduction histidine kinase